MEFRQRWLAGSPLARRRACCWRCDPSGAPGRRRCEPPSPGRVGPACPTPNSRRLAPTPDSGCCALPPACAPTLRRGDQLNRRSRCARVQRRRPRRDRQPIQAPLTHQPFSLRTPVFTGRSRSGSSPDRQSSQRRRDTRHAARIASSATLSADVISDRRRLPIGGRR